MENYDIQTIQDMLGQSAKTAMLTAATVANLSDQMGMILLPWVLFRARN